MSLVVHAPAKLNLDLRILGQRRDGYHELRTLFQSISLHDTLRLARRSGPMSVTSRMPAVPRDEANLVWRAAKALWDSVGRRGEPEGVAVAITKRIPLAGGLGGGSSDAASALRGLCRLWGLSPSMKRLQELAATVGADVPYFLTGGLVLGTGHGIRLRRLVDLESHWVVLAVPRFGVPAASAYEWFDQDSRDDQISTAALPRGWRSRLDLLHNDLQAPVVVRYPGVAAMVERLRATGGAHAAMTGSGSTVFGLYRRKADAVAARRAVRLPGWRTILSRTVGSVEFARLSAVGPRS